MRIMGRKRTVHKDIPPGTYRSGGRVYYRGTNKGESDRIFALLGKRAPCLGADSKLNEVWSEYHDLKKRLIPLDASQADAGTIAELVADYRLEEMPLLAKKTAYERNFHLREIVNEFGSRRYATSASEAPTGPFLRLMHIQAFLKANIHRPSAANHVVRTLHAVFLLAKRNGRTEYDPTVDVKEHAERARKVRPSDDLMLKVYAAASPRMQCVMDICVMCGTRKEDIPRILMQHVDDPGDPDGEIRIYNWKQLEKAKNLAKRDFKNRLRDQEELTAEEREPFIRSYPYRDRPELREVIARAIAIRAAIIKKRSVVPMNLFVTEKGCKAMSYSALSTDWTRLKKELGIKRGEFRFHDHRRITESQATGANLKSHEILGHADEKTTKKHYKADRLTLVAAPPVRRKAQ